MINYLVNIEDLKELGLIHKNVDTKLLAVCVKRAQDMEIQTALGTPLFRELLRRVEDDDWNTPYNKLMKDYVIPALVAWTDYRAIDYLNVKITNKNTGRGNDENRPSNTYNENRGFRGRLQTDAEFYRDRLIGFLKDNCDLYDEYKVNNKNHEDVKKQDQKSGFKNTVI